MKKFIVLAVLTTLSCCLAGLVTVWSGVDYQTTLAILSGAFATMTFATFMILFVTVATAFVTVTLAALAAFAITTASIITVVTIATSFVSLAFAIGIITILSAREGIPFRKLAIVYLVEGIIIFLFLNLVLPLVIGN